MAKDDDDDDDCKDAVKGKDKKAKDKAKGAKDEDDDEDENTGPGKPAMDAAIKSVEKSIRDRFQAAKDIKPYVGEVDPMSFDSAAKIHRFALKQGDIDLTGVDPSAYKHLLKLLPRFDEVAPAVTMDAAAVKAFNDKYPYKPSLG